MTREELEEGRDLVDSCVRDGSGWDSQVKSSYAAEQWLKRHASELLSLAEEARWIPVEDASPELMEEVLVYPNDANASSACAYLTEHGWRYGDFCGDCNPVPTHWRPLPKGPER